MKSSRAVVCFVAIAAMAALWVLPSDAQTPAPKGTFEKIKVHGKSLEGNLEGDSPDRDVFVYLPPSYGKEKNRRYPVVYFLHGYGLGAEQYWNIMTVPDAADTNMGSGTVRPFARSSASSSANGFPATATWWRPSPFEARNSA